MENLKGKPPKITYSKTKNKNGKNQEEKSPEFA